MGKDEVRLEGPVAQLLDLTRSSILGKFVGKEFFLRRHGRSIYKNIQISTQGYGAGRY